MNRRRNRFLILALGPAAVAALIWVCFRSPVPEPDPLTAAALERAADRWCLSDARYGREIPEVEWPPELLGLRPKSVWVAPEGVFIRFGEFYVTHWGLFVLPGGSDFRPERGFDPPGRLLRGRVYRYEVSG